MLLASAVAALRLVGEPAWHAGNDHRWTELPVPVQSETGFELLSPTRTGVTFTNQLSELENARNRVLSNGSGLAFGDYDPDLCACSDHWTPDRFWINDGTGRFRALPALAVRQTPFSCTGVHFAAIGLLRIRN